MIVFGSKATELITEIIPSKCANCGTEHNMQMTVFQKYGHIFWIPFIPMGKTAVTQCSHCKQVLEKKEFTRDLRFSYDAIRSKTKIPIWTYSGLGLFAAFIVLGAISSNQRDERNTNFISEPQVGDVYEIKIEYKQYTLYKVGNISGDTVFVLAHQFETNKKSGLRELKRKGDAGFFEDLLPIHKAELKEMLDNGEIMEVERY
nr:zinc-ribbon domain-containing protein [Cytophagales bacterium]